MADYDLIVIGAGPGGYVAAIRGAQKGLKVAVVEKEHVGGCCLNQGCVPTKALMHATHLYREIRHAEKFGLDVAGVEADLHRIYENKNKTVETLRGGIEQLFKANKVDLHRGTAAITGENTIKITGPDPKTLSADKILIAVGGKPFLLSDDVMNTDGVYTSDQILGNSPMDFNHVVIIGAGVIAVEFAMFYSDLGRQVTIAARSGVLPRMDREISQNTTMIMKKRGVNFEQNADIQRIEKTSGGLKCIFDQKGETLEIDCDGVIAAVGRMSNIEGLFEGYDKVISERGAIVINENCQTSVPNIYAIGDCTKGSIQLAHAASAQGMNAISHMVGEAPVMDMAVIPSCIYTDPEIASVGLTADEAKEKGITAKTGKYVMNGNAKSLLSEQERSFIKVVFDGSNDKIIGAQLMCARATDMIGELAVGIKNGLTIHQLSSVIRPHPTFEEAVGEAIEDVEKMAIHIAPKVKL